VIIIFVFLFLFSPTNSFATNTGWDYDLTKKCVKTIDKNTPQTYFEDTTQCTTGDKNWTLGIQSEKDLGQTCFGINGQSLAVNQENSLLSINWIPHTNEFNNSNWKVDLTTDLVTKTHPCGAGKFTWYVLMDHTGHHGGPLANPQNISSSIDLTVNTDNSSNNATRALVAWGGWWDGKLHEIEMNFYISDKWGDNDPQPDIITSVKNSDMEFISMNSRVSPWNIYINPNETKNINIKWIDVINSLISRGYMTTPVGGWNNATSVVVYVGTEVNNFTATNAGKTTLSVTNFRNSDTSQTKTISLLTPQKSFNILNPVPGKSETECTIGTPNPKSDWNIAQWKNEKSLCTGANDAITNCPGASLIKANETSRICFWDNNKIQIALNTQNMTNKGCSPNTTGTNAQNPGGYSIHLTNDLIKSDTNYWQEPLYKLSNLSKINLSTNFKTDYFQSTQCSDSSKLPVATAYFNVIVNEINPTTKLSTNTIFYQTVLYDNRLDWQENKTDYFNCSLPSSTNPNGFVVISDPIGKYGYTMPKAGENDKNFMWDVLPKVKDNIQKCLGNKDLNNFYISNVFFGNELENTTVMTNTFTNPTVKLVPSTIIIGDFNNDNTVNLLDFTFWKIKYLAGQMTLLDFGVWKTAYLLH